MAAKRAKISGAGAFKSGRMKARLSALGLKRFKALQKRSLRG
jgi:hypothetical protein